MKKETMQDALVVNTPGGSFSKKSCTQASLMDGSEREHEDVMAEEDNEEIIRKIRKREQKRMS